jgi:hypothetical protein
MAQRGTIRLVTGLLLTLGAVGGMEQQPEGPLLLQIGIAVVGLALIFWAVRDINRNTNEILANLK